METIPHQQTTILPGRTPENLKTRDFVHDLAREHAAGRIDVAGIRATCPPRDIFTAVCLTPRGHPDLAALLAMIDALIASPADPDGPRCYWTKHGWLTEAEIERLSGRMFPHRGRRAIQFPFRFTAGGEPVYRFVPGYDLSATRFHDTPLANFPPLDDEGGQS